MRSRLPSRRPTAYDLVRTSLAILLLTAAALKGHQLATEPTIGEGILASRWFLMAVVEFELFFALWLLSGLLPRATWAAALCCFGMFACYSLGKAVSGQASCGCFGRVAVNPWYTFALDTLAVTALLCFRPNNLPSPAGRGAGGEGESDEGRLLPNALSAPRSPRLALLFVFYLLAALPAGWAMAIYRPATLDAAGVISGDGRTVVLQPERWIGNRLPLLGHIDIGDRLAQGDWLVVLIHHDCPRCQDLLSRLRVHFRDDSRAADAARLSLVELPPFGAETIDAGHGVVQGRMVAGREWFAQTPVVLRVSRGRVVEVLGVGGLDDEKLTSSVPAARQGRGVIFGSEG